MTVPQPRTVDIPLPPGTSPRERAGFLRLSRALSHAALSPLEPIDRAHWFAVAKLPDLYNAPVLAAASHALIDLLEQGWRVTAEGRVPRLIAPPPRPDATEEKARIRKQEHLRRDAQLKQSSVRRFVEQMEKPREFNGQLVSVFSLMRDGRELTEALASDGQSMKPYVQVVDGGRCEYTGLGLHDVWRYFRHTWSNAYATVPGRSMPILVRDAAAPNHPIIGLAAISSPVVQIAERDRWMGWDTDVFLAQMTEDPRDEIAQWLLRRLEIQRAETFYGDLLEEGVLDPTDFARPSLAAVERLKEDAERQRQKHHRSTFRDVDRNAWGERTRTPLFRGKRSLVLAEILEASLALNPYLRPDPSAEGLAAALADRVSRSQIRRLIRRARGERVGTVVADLTVCGAVAPYNALAAGKLVAALAVSPPVITAYRRKYERPSQIASSIAGRPIVRESRLSLITTTSLYGSGSSQYNRLRWPASVMGGDALSEIRFEKLGRSRSFGTSQFSDATVDALVRLSHLQGSGVRVNGVFGEGVSPRMRKVRFGLAALGWSANDLLRHGRERIVYGVGLVQNLRDYSLGIDDDPRYLLDTESEDAANATARWWFARWGRQRAQSETVQAAMRANSLARPVRHSARVSLPAMNDS